MDKRQRNLKRKRTESDDQEDDELKISGKLHHGLKEIRKAAKKAKTFETQKIVKRLKNLKKKEQGSSDIAECEAELDALKDVRHELVAYSATKSKIMKDRILSRHEHIQRALSQETGSSLLPTFAQNTPEAKVRSRLLSSKALATEISSVLDDLRRFVGNESEKTRTGDGRDVTSAVTQDIGSPRSEVPGVADHFSHMDVGLENGDTIVDDAGWESGTVEDLEDNTDVRSWESESMSRDAARPNSLHGEDSSEDDEGVESDGSAASTARNAIGAVRTQKTAANKASNVTSTFLPSLSVGFVRDSDGSDWSDSEAQMVDLGKRKNRRGQRARRAIWEKKYGKNANHTKKILEAQNNASWKDAGANRRKHYRGPALKFAGPSVAASEGKDAGHPQHIRRQSYGGPKSEERPLHPSWEAKKKLKEKQDAGILQSQGTKIKFSD